MGALSVIIDALFPSHCVSCRAPASGLCGHCTARLNPEFKPIKDGIFALVQYGQKEARALVFALKFFSSSRGAAKGVANMIALYGLLPLIKKEGALIIIPIPSSKSVSWRNGSRDHLALLAKALSDIAKSQRLPFSVRTDILLKIRSTKRQVETLSRTQRLSNLRHAYTTKANIDLSMSTIVIIDDVTTTGATFTEARQALSALKPKKVIALAFAH